MAQSRTVVLVHGAWHGPWCWERVTPLLDRAGVPHREVELPFTSHADDVAATRAALDAFLVAAGTTFNDAVADAPPDTLRSKVLDALRAHDDGSHSIEPAKAVETFFRTTPADDAAAAVKRLRAMASNLTAARPERA